MFRRIHFAGILLMVGIVFVADTAFLVMAV
jgi:hypothetical protein